jgi:hypothetical protein
MFVQAVVSVLCWFFGGGAFVQKKGERCQVPRFQLSHGSFVCVNKVRGKRLPGLLRNIFALFNLTRGWADHSQGEAARHSGGQHRIYPQDRAICSSHFLVEGTLQISTIITSWQTLVSGGQETDVQTRRQRRTCRRPQESSSSPVSAQGGGRSVVAFVALCAVNVLRCGPGWRQPNADTNRNIVRLKRAGERDVHELFPSSSAEQNVDAGVVPQPPASQGRGP